jgi:hypothetical protein
MPHTLPFLLMGLALMGRDDAKPTAVPSQPAAPRLDLKPIEDELASRHGEAERERLARGLKQAASLWRAEDGDAGAFAEVARRHFVPRGPELDALFARLERAFEEIDGHLNEVSRELRRVTDLDLGPIRPIDELLAAYNPYAHLGEDLFAEKVGFAVLLNFSVTTLAERLRDGPRWTRHQWAEARLAARFAKRVPPEVEKDIARAVSAGETYIAEYNLWMHHVLDAEGKRLFPRGLRLISHWNLRDELKAAYALPDGLPRQRLIAGAMERIATQTIPRAAINDPRVDWRPDTNEVRPAPADTVEPGEARPPLGPLDGAREPDTRYAHLLATFRAARGADPYSPAAPTLIARRFEEDRELPEERVRGLLESVLASPCASRVAALIARRLGRKLEPFDIWYSGFQTRSRFPESELDVLTRAHFPSAEAFAAKLPDTLVQLGFRPERARYLAERIAVDASRGAGHAMPALRRGDKPRLRTRVEKDGMNYKGFNIAIHELGHNVEQVFSLYDVDHTLLAGVPNNAFTEAMAFVFQARDLGLLGLEKGRTPGSPPPAGAPVPAAAGDSAGDAEREHLRVLNEFWMTFEIAGPALVDMAAWRWMYEHPDASAAELREAVIAIAKDLWARRYAPVLGAKESVLLAIYSHMVNLMMYLPDYPIGHLIAFQIEEHLKGKDLGAEVERMARIGRVSPDQWMVSATGEPVSAEPMLKATERALKEMGAW